MSGGQALAKESPPRAEGPEGEPAGGRYRALARAVAPYLVLAAGLLAVYAPTLRSGFLFSDDYANFVEPPPYAWLLAGTGRPVQYLVASWAHRLVALDPANVLVVRLVLFSLWVVLAAALYAFVRRALGANGAVALVLFVFSVPAFLITFAWLSVAVNVPAYLAATASYLTGFLLLRGARGLATRLALGAATVVLVAAASLSYQIAGTLPLALAVFHLLFEERERRSHRGVAILYALVAAGIVLSLFALRVILLAAHLAPGDRVEAFGQRIASVRGLLIPFKILSANFALHYYYWPWVTRDAAMVLGLALSVLVVRSAWRGVRRENPLHREERVRWGLVLAAFLAGGMLFAVDASRELRSKPFLTLLLVFVSAYAVRETRAWARLRQKRAAVFGLMAFTMMSGRHALASGLVPYAEGELAFVREALSRAAPATLRRVHVVQPENHCFSLPCYGWFEFNIKLATSHDFVPRGMVRYALAQLGRSAEGVETAFSRARAADPGALEIDMRPLEERLLAERGELVDLETFRKRKLRASDVAGLSGSWIRMAPPSRSAEGQGGK